MVREEGMPKQVVKKSSKKSSKKKYVFFFGGGKADARADMKAIVGGKGANLAEMTLIGLPVPPGFTLSTEVCQIYYERGKKYPSEVKEQVQQCIRKLERITGKRFGDPSKPLLVSVRSGAAASMPGMMDTVLNLGLNSRTVEGMVKLTGNERFTWDAYRRFLQMFGDVVMEVPHHEFEEALDGVKKHAGAKVDTDLSADDLKEVVRIYKEIYFKYTGSQFPENPEEQLWYSINAVFGSWNNPRAIKYRQLYDIKGLLGTAVNVQTMVFGNMGEDSGTGVAFTRNPSNGKNEFYGEYLMNAQGEDVVAGIRTPNPISQLKKVNSDSYNHLLKIRSILEKHYKDMQDLEFTIEKGTLYILQTRAGKRTATAAVKMAVDMVKERLIKKEEAIRRVSPISLDQLLHPMFDEAEEKKATILSSEGLAASPGAATGQVVFSAEDAEARAAMGEKVILCRLETSPEDIGGMAVAQGILTARGGQTSHAAVVARGMGKCCVAGAGDVAIDHKNKRMMAAGKTIQEGDWISLNGSKGILYEGCIPTVEPKMTGPFEVLMKWADSIRKLGIRTNADTPRDAQIAVKLGAEGIGLCRTEHMFFEADRILSFRKLILVAPQVRALRSALEDARTEAEEAKIRHELKVPLTQYEKALESLLPHQRSDFEGIFMALKGLPCTIRTLDPPLHEFLPHDEDGQRELAEALNVSEEKVKNTVESLKEFNPMLGHRGCRLGLTYPEVTEMQVRAIMEAACHVRKRGVKVQPEIMIPLVGTARELEISREQVERVIQKVFQENKMKKSQIPYKIGTMIEVPRAAVTADEVALHADFFSFGTNDLTQMGCGFSRDDAGRFLGEYVRMGIYEYDPFQVLDQAGVGKLVEMACRLGRQVQPKIKLGICGEHGGDPMSIKFCHRIGLTYVSCSPYRVPIARLAAAQAVFQA